MQLKGLERLLQFCELLRWRKVDHRIAQYSCDCIQVSLRHGWLPLRSILFVDHIEYSVFYGHEDVETDSEALLELIGDNA